MYHSLLAEPVPAGFQNKVEQKQISAANKKSQIRKEYFIASGLIVHRISYTTRMVSSEKRIISISFVFFFIMPCHCVSLLPIIFPSNTSKIAKTKSSNLVRQNNSSTKGS
jgi:hypothetical protein